MVVGQGNDEAECLHGRGARAVQSRSTTWHWVNRDERIAGVGLTDWRQWNRIVTHVMIQRSLLPRQGKHAHWLPWQCSEGVTCV